MTASAVMDLRPTDAPLTATQDGGRAVLILLDGSDLHTESEQLGRESIVEEAEQVGTVHLVGGAAVVLGGALPQWSLEQQLVARCAPVPVRGPARRSPEHEGPGPPLHHRFLLPRS
jgi:hypothetical protein